MFRVYGYDDGRRGKYAADDSTSGLYGPLPESRYENVPTMRYGDGVRPLRPSVGAAVTSFITSTVFGGAFLILWLSISHTAFSSGMDNFTVNGQPGTEEQFRSFKLVFTVAAPLFIAALTIVLPLVKLIAAVVEKRRSEL